MALSGAYRTVIRAADVYVPAKFRPVWEHAAGPKTVFFWAPAFKWCLVVAGLGDANRPAEKLSVGQAGALAATGIIWSRYSLVIKPKNISLFSVNIFVAATGLFQLGKIFLHRREQKALKAAS